MGCFFLKLVQGRQQRRGDGVGGHPGAIRNGTDQILRRQTLRDADSGIRIYLETQPSNRWFDEAGRLVLRTLDETTRALDAPRRRNSLPLLGVSVLNADANALLNLGYLHFPAERSPRSLTEVANSARSGTRPGPDKQRIHPDGCIIPPSSSKEPLFPFPCGIR